MLGRWPPLGRGQVVVELGCALSRFVDKRTNRINVKRHEADGTLCVQARHARKSVRESSICALKFHPGLSFFSEGNVRPT